MLASAVQIYRHVKALAPGQTTPLAYWGMHVAHIGIAVCVIGITMVKGYETEKDVRMALGDTVSVGGYTFRLTGISERRGPNYNANVGTVELLQDGKLRKPCSLKSAPIFHPPCQ